MQYNPLEFIEVSIKNHNETTKFEFGHIVQPLLNNLNKNKKQEEKFH